MRGVDFSAVIHEAWQAYGEPIPIQDVTDISVRVSTNYVFRVDLNDGRFLFAKVSYFGKYEDFKEDHTIINILAHLLPWPYDHFLSRSLTKDGKLFIQRHKTAALDVWLVFYRPIDLAQKLPRRLDEGLIVKMGKELARFHRACTEISGQLPQASKTLYTDLDHLHTILDTELGQFIHRGHVDAIRHHTHVLRANLDHFEYDALPRIPVFIDWNIGNFSVMPDGAFFSRWDYDWFRMASRLLDFYFFSRVVSDVGDRTVFSYEIYTLLEDRFLIFLKAYHAVYPLTRNEVFLLKEAYRFFILNYVIKDGRYFFHEFYALRLQKEAYEQYLPSIDRDFDVDRILHALEL